jgi:hypothetical protein
LQIVLPGERVLYRIAERFYLAQRHDRIHSNPL